MTATLLALALLGPAQPAAQPVWHTARVSWYEQGTVTANGERFDPDANTCAHRTLPFGTRITFRYRGATVTCRVNDRCPRAKGREFDLARGAGQLLGIYRKGVAKVQWREVSRG
jgi:rare lipoprotein A